MTDRQPLHPIDVTARDGSFRLISNGSEQAVARWRGRWEYASGRPVAFEPTGYVETGEGAK